VRDGGSGSENGPSVNLDPANPVYPPAQTRKQEPVSDATNVLADACLNCHVVYRDKEGGPAADPSNKAARCQPWLAALCGS
jgi:hypothetical protein